MSDAREPEEPSPSEARTSRASAGWSGLFGRLKFLKRHIVAVAAVGAVLSGLVGYWTTYRTVHEVITPAVVGDARPGAQSPPAMSVVVAPLAAPKSDADAVRFADALTRELVSRLGRVNSAAGRLRVVAFQGAPAGEVVDPGELGRRLNARYVLEGNVLHGADGNTVNLQLVDAATRGQIWSERNTLHDSDVSGESSVRLRNLARQLLTGIVVAEKRRVLAQSESALSAQDLVLRAWALWDQDPSLRGVHEMRELVNRAQRLDTNSLSALLARVRLDVFEANTDPKADRGRLTREIDEDTARAVQLDPTDPVAWNFRALTLLNYEHWGAALEANATAIKLDPDEPDFLSSRATIMNTIGRPGEALELIDRALAIDTTTRNASRAASTACTSHMLLGQTEQAIAMCEKATALYGDRSVQPTLVAAYTDHGDMEKAAAAKVELLRNLPGYTVAQARANDEPLHPEYAKLAEKYYYEGLRKAGIPEQ